LMAAQWAVPKAVQRVVYWAAKTVVWKADMMAEYLAD
jgi:hypothetical protein